MWHSKTMFYLPLYVTRNQLVTNKPCDLEGGAVYINIELILLVSCLSTEINNISSIINRETL